MRETVYHSAEDTYSHRYIADKVIGHLRSHSQTRRVLDAGCGNGSLAGRIAECGFDVSAFDLSKSGIEYARKAFSNVHFEVASVYDDLTEVFDQRFDACIATEVLEHLFDPRLCLRRVSEVLHDGGLLIVTTPYHGYVKNVALTVTNKMDDHFTALTDGGHIKFWSRRTLSMLLEQCGFQLIGFEGAGRLPFLWKSMILVSCKKRLPPGESANC